MKLAALFSGGKDSVYAMYKAQQQGHSIEVLVTIQSENPESYMFHTPNIGLTELQAEALNIPIYTQMTKGVKEEELVDLKAAIATVKEQYGIEGVVTGAVESRYQGVRIQKICDELDLWCFNPLWLKNQVELLEEVVNDGFKVIITLIAAEGFDGSWLGRELNQEMITELQIMNKKRGISPAFEGGEAETLVVAGPSFKKELKIKESKKVLENSFTGYLDVIDVKLV